MEKKGRYSPGFEAAWAAYPHFECRSKKKLAAAVWGRDKLDLVADKALAWIAWAKTTHDWTMQGGKYVPGMQVWLNGRDFDDPIPRHGVEHPPPLGGLMALDEAKRAELRRASDERIRQALLARDERERRLGRR